MKQDEYRRFNVLQEQTLREDVNTMKLDLQFVKEDVSVLKSVARSPSEEFPVVKVPLAEIKGDGKSQNRRLEIIETDPAS